MYGFQFIFLDIINTLNANEFFADKHKVFLNYIKDNYLNIKLKII